MQTYKGLEHVLTQTEIQENVAGIQAKREDGLASRDGLELAKKDLNC